MSAQRSIGTKLKLVTSTTTMYIADLTKIGEIGIESNEIDVTTLDSPFGFKEFIAGDKDAGELSFEGYIKSESNMETMLQLANSQTVVNWVIEFPSGAKWFFTGFVKSFKEAESTVEGVRGFTGSIRISGAPVYSSTGVSA